MVAATGEKDDWALTSMSGMNGDSDSNPSAASASNAATSTSAPAEDDDDDDSIPNLDDFGLDEADEADDNAIAPIAVPAATTSSALATSSAKESGSSSGTRIYDISIVYNKYYRTPCVYLIGKDEFGGSLSVAQIWEDVSSEHSNKTITQGDHPHTGLPHLFIHPCKHSVTMKSMLSMLEEEQTESVHLEQRAAMMKYDEAMKKYKDDMEVFQDSTRVQKPVMPVFTEEATKKKIREAMEKAMPVDQYLMLFLKFINTIIPTVEYDFTMSSL